MRVLIVDDSPIIRISLRSLLGVIPEVEIVGEAGDGQQAIEMVQLLDPDVVLMDVEMPIMNGITAVAQIAAANPRTHILMVSLYNNNSFIREAFHNGASGYLLKTELLTALPNALLTVASGKIFYAPQMLANDEWPN